MSSCSLTFSDEWSSSVKPSEFELNKQQQLITKDILRENESDEQKTGGER